MLNCSSVENFKIMYLQYKDQEYKTIGTIFIAMEIRPFLGSQSSYVLFI